MYQSERITSLQQLGSIESAVEMFDAAQDLMRAGMLGRRHYVNDVSGTLTYTLADGRTVVEVDVARGFVQPYNDRLEDVYRPVDFRLHAESIHR